MTKVAQCNYHVVKTMPNIVRLYHFVRVRIQNLAAMYASFKGYFTYLQKMKIKKEKNVKLEKISQKI